MAALVKFLDDCNARGESAVVQRKMVADSHVWHRVPLLHLGANTTDGSNHGNSHARVPELLHAK